MKEYGLIDFVNEKYKIEKEKFGYIEEKGGSFIGLTAAKLKDHYNLYKHILTEEDRFIVVEQSKEIHKKINNNYAKLPAQDKKKVYIYYGDIFNIIEEHKVDGLKHNLKFRMLHLDFCVGLQGIIDQGVLTNIRKLDKYNLLTNPFYLDITSCLRSATLEQTSFILTKTIPAIMALQKWVVNPNIIREYHYKSNGGYMYTTLLKFYKETKEKRRFKSENDCFICGLEFKVLKAHLTKTHGLTYDDYFYLNELGIHEFKGELKDPRLSCLN